MALLWAALRNPATTRPSSDLLGLMACGELLAFERLAHDASLAPTMDDKAELARMAVAEFSHFTVLAARARRRWGWPRPRRWPRSSSR